MSATNPVGRRRTLTWITAAATLGALVALPMAAEAAAAAAPRCFGAEATIVGTSGDDVLIGTPGPDVIVARGGADIIQGLSGKDRICAGGGDDTVRAGLGGDWVDGGPGDDLLGGHRGDDKLFGGRGDDSLFGHAGNDRLDGGLGTDRCFQWPGEGPVLNCETADLSVSVTGQKRTKTGDAIFVITVANEGPTAVTYWLELSQSTNNADCVAPSWAGTHHGALLVPDSYRDLEVMASCVKVGKRSRVFVDAAVSSHAPDPDPSNNADQHKTNVRFKGS